MKSTLWWLSLIFGTLSVVMLIKQAFTIGLVSVLEVTLGYYEDVTKLLAVVALPVIEKSLETLGLEMNVPNAWAQAFVLIMVVLGSLSRNTNVGGVGQIVLAFCAAILAFVTSVLQLSLTQEALEAMLDGGSKGFWNRSLLGLAFSLPFWAATVHVAAIAAVSRLHWVARGAGAGDASSSLRFAATVGAAVAGTILLMLATGLHLRRPSFVPAAGEWTLLMIAYVLVLAIAFLLVGSFQMLRYRFSETWAASRSKAVMLRTGLTLASIVAGAAVFIATNAGLKLAGL